MSAIKTGEEQDYTVMAKRGTFSTGTSGNPRGRPPKGRAFTEMLSLHGDDSVEFEGERISGKEAVSRLMWRLLVRGRIELEGRTLAFESAKEWLEAARFVLVHIDGHAPKENQHSGEVVLQIVRQAPQS